MLHKLYSKFIEPRSQDDDSRNRELVLNYLLIGLIVVISAELVAAFLGFWLLHEHYIAFRLLGIIGVLAFFVLLYTYSRHREHYQRRAAFIVIGVLLGLTTLVVSSWGTVTPTGTLLFGLIIVMAGILLGSRYSLYAAVASIAILGLFEYLKNRGVVVPNIAWMQRPSSFSDIVGFGIIFGVIALILWLYNQQMERSLQRAHASEAALNKQNESLEQIVETRTRQLEVAQMEKLQQVYRFAELGRISSALFHDLANHLTAVSLDIEGLTQARKSKLVHQVQNDIKYIDDIVQRVRLQLRGQSEPSRFNVVSEIQTVIKTLNHTIVQNRITFHAELPSEPIYCKADIVPFRQIITNLLNNAIEAYAKSRKTHKPIILHVETDGSIIRITVHDEGVGIKPGQQQRIFEPFYSSKTDGTGIGLFIIKQIIENDLRGTISLTSTPKQGTTFTVNLPCPATSNKIIK